MNNNARKWVEALRSGKYQQGQNRLATVEPDGIKYCCLGIACDLYKQEHPEFPVEQVKTFILHLVYGSDIEGYALPKVVNEWLGLKLYGDWDHGSLAGRNDSGISFAAITDIIESEPEGLFA